MFDHFWRFLLLRLMVSFRVAIAGDASCSRIDFNSAELTFLTKCSNYQEFIAKPYTDSTVFTPFRENAAYYLSPRKQGLTCGETVQSFKMNSQTEFRMVYNLVFHTSASLQIRLLDLGRLDSENKPTLVERWQTVQSTAGWGLFREKLNKTVDRAKIQIEANMNSGSDVAVEYLTIFNYEVETDECTSLDEFATTTTVEHTTSMSSSPRTTSAEVTPAPPIKTSTQATTMSTTSTTSTSTTTALPIKTTTISTTTQTPATTTIETTWTITSTEATTTSTQTMITRTSDAITSTSPTTITLTSDVITATEQSTAGDKPSTSTTNVPRDESTPTTQQITSSSLQTTIVEDTIGDSDESIAVMSTANWLWITLAVTFAVLFGLAITCVVYIYAANRKLHKVNYKMRVAESTRNVTQNTSINGKSCFIEEIRIK